jgi:hypothetical protein
MKVKRREFDQKSLAELARKHSRAEIIAALDDFGCNPPSKKRRTPTNAGSKIATWVAVEWFRDKVKTRSVQGACKLLAAEIAIIQPVSTSSASDVTVTPPPGWNQIKAEHHEVEVVAKHDPAFRKMLDDRLSERRAASLPGDVLLPARFVGGEDCTAWVILSDKPRPGGSYDMHDPACADGMLITVQSEKGR